MALAVCRGDRVRVVYHPPVLQQQDGVVEDVGKRTFLVRAGASFLEFWLRNGLDRNGFFRSRVEFPRA